MNVQGQVDGVARALEEGTPDNAHLTAWPAHVIRHTSLQGIRQGAEGSTAEAGTVDDCSFVDRGWHERLEAI